MQLYSFIIHTFFALSILWDVHLLKEQKLDKTIPEESTFFIVR